MKARKSPSPLGSFRPIGLTSCVGKLWKGFSSLVSVVGEYQDSRQVSGMKEVSRNK